MKYILGIETTAHTFGVAVVDENGKILSNEKDAFTTEDGEGGMIPMRVKKHHEEVAPKIYRQALEKAQISEDKIIAVAFSNAPGLAPCLIAGMEFAKATASRLNIPLVPVNHCIAHLEIGEITGAKDPVLLYASGANTQVIAYEAGKYRVFGETLDTGVGNFIDTFARYAGIGFPGGPKIQKLASDYKEISKKLSKVVLVHGSNENDIENMKRYNLPQQNERSWFPWIESEIKKEGLTVIAPLMPENWKPDYNKWKKEFEKIDIDENSILIGHSAGGSFLVRWLGETGKKIKKLILISPAIANNFKENWEKEDFYNFKINRNIRNNIREIVLFESSNDDKNLLMSGEIFSNELGVEPIVLKNRGHFTNRGNNENTTFSELLEEIILTFQNPNLIELPYSIKGMDVSFSGILTKLRRMLESKKYSLEDLSFSMQETVFAMLVEASERALAHTGKKELLLGGGVACNGRLQEMCKIMCEERGVKFFCPERPLLVDNAGMIGYLGLKMFKKGLFFRPEDFDKVDIAPRERTDDVEVLWKLPQRL